MADSKVEIRVSKMKSNVMVEVNNPVKYDILLDNPHHQTTKKDRRKHGLGLAIVRDITEKYDGSFYHEVEKGTS